MDTGKLTIVHLTDEQARLFIKFQKHHALIGLLESIGAFDIRDGNIKIHFNHLGEIKVVDKYECYRLP